MHAAHLVEPLMRVRVRIGDVLEMRERRYVDDDERKASSFLGDDVARSNQPTVFQQHVLAPHELPADGAARDAQRVRL